MHKKENTKVLNLSLTPSEIKTLEDISKDFFGKENKSGMVRYWINKHKSKNWFSVVANGLAMISKIETRTNKLLTNIGFY